MSDTALDGVTISRNMIFNGDKNTGSSLIAQADFFGPGSNSKRRVLQDYEQLRVQVEALKQLGKKIVLTLGVYDLIHCGQARYLEEAKARGDVLIIAVELDDAVKLRKGPRRPVVPYGERVEMLCHLRHVDLVVPVLDFDPKTGLSGMKIHEIIRPHVVIASVRSFQENHSTREWIAGVKKYCDRVEVLESQAETSTTNQIRNLIIGYSDVITEALSQAKTTTALALDTVFNDLKEIIHQAREKI